MIAVSDLADNLRDAILEYQVCTDTEKQTPDSSLTPFPVLAADGNLQARLYIDCESQGPRSG
jgi:hypothetical protein